MNLSTNFLIFILEILDNEFCQKVQNTYCGNIYWEGTDNWGDYYYVVLNDPSTRLLTILRDHPEYKDEFYTEDEQFMMVFGVPPKYRNTVMEPFLEGKYSQIDRQYVDKYFLKYTGPGMISSNWLILHKDDYYKRQWEVRLDTPLPEGAEVWSKRKKEEEVYGYSSLVEEPEEELLESM